MLEESIAVEAHLLSVHQSGQDLQLEHLIVSGLPHRVALRSPLLLSLPVPKIGDEGLAVISGLRIGVLVSRLDAAESEHPDFPLNGFP